MDPTTFRMMMSSPATGPALADYPLRNSATDPTFSGCVARLTPGYTFTPFVGINTSVPITDMSSMFLFNSFNDPDIALWNTSLVTNMESMFYGCSSFNQPIGSWNTANVTTMENMLAGTPINQPLNSWNVSNVTNMTTMFQDCYFFNQPLNNWNTSKVTIMLSMFGYAYSFNQNISNWNVGNVTNMDYMFLDALAFTQNLSPWVTKITSQPTDFSVGANTTFANNANLRKPFLQGGTIRINT